jgi:hypothetical protein
MPLQLSVGVTDNSSRGGVIRVETSVDQELCRIVIVIALDIYDANPEVVGFRHITASHLVA